MQIRVSPDALRSVAKQQESIINNIAEETSKINDLVNQLTEAWEGASGTQARNTLEEIRNGIKKILDGAGDSVKKLISVADAFESIDSGENVLAIKQFPTGFVPIPIRPKLILSMPGLVRIDPDRVREIAEQCKVVAVSILDSASSFSDSVKGLSDDWEGRSYAKYEDEASEIIKALREVEDDMNEFVSRIVNAANRYEEIDNSL